MSKSFMETVYGPLSKEYCIYFYILSIIGFVLLIIVILSTLLIGITKKKDSKFYMEMFMLCIPYALIYFTNRLLYSMCSGALGVKEGAQSGSNAEQKQNKNTNVADVTSYVGAQLSSLLPTPL